MLNPQQKKLVDSMQGKNKEEQNKILAEYCNQNGITKEQLQSVARMF